MIRTEQVCDRLVIWDDEPTECCAHQPSFEWIDPPVWIDNPQSPYPEVRWLPKQCRGCGLMHLPPTVMISADSSSSAIKRAIGEFRRDLEFERLEQLAELVRECRETFADLEADDFPAWDVEWSDNGDGAIRVGPYYVGDDGAYGFDLTWWNALREEYDWEWVECGRLDKDQFAKLVALADDAD